MLSDLEEADQLDLVKSHIAPVHLYSYGLRDLNAYGEVSLGDNVAAANSGGGDGGAAAAAAAVAVLPLSERDFKPIAKLFMDLISLQVQGAEKTASDVNEAVDQAQQGTDWVKLANKTLPAAFSKLFGGIPNKPLQNLCRDLKVSQSSAGRSFFSSSLGRGILFYSKKM